MAFDLGEFQKKAEALKEQMAAAQSKLRDMEVEGTAGGGMVKVRLNGKYEAKKVFIDDALLKEPKEVLCDVIASAITDATQKVEENAKNSMMSLLQNAGLPNL